jgi:hypothetical protein
MNISSIHASLASVVVAAAAFAGSSSVHGALIAQYHFDESSGATAFDSVGSVHGALSLTGAAFSAGGISGNAISLSQPAGGYVSMGNNFSLSAGDFSIVLWVKTTTALNDTIAVSKHHAGSANGYFFGISPTGSGGSPNKASFYTSEAVGAGNGPTSTTSVNDGQWHQVVGVYQASGSASIYVDGAPAEATTSSPSIIANTASFLIGGVTSGGTPTSRYTGLIDEVEIYNHALTSAEVQARFNSVPEPSAAMFGAVSALVLLLRRNRNQRSA